MKTAERVIMVLLLLVLIGAGAWLYFSVTEYTAITDDLEERRLDRESRAQAGDESDWRRYYPVTTPIVIASTTVLASVAETVPERIKGLSDTPYLPENVVKLFVFGAEGRHSIWMKDMNYSIDILWADRSGEIVHIEERVSPDTYPTSFSSPIPAWYVIETNEGFVESNNIQVGDVMQLVE